MQTLIKGVIHYCTGYQTMILMSYCDIYNRNFMRELSSPQQDMGQVKL